MEKKMKRFIFGSLVFSIAMLSVGCSGTSNVSTLKTDGGGGGNVVTSSSVTTSSVSSSVSSTSSGTTMVECNPPTDCANKNSK